jgi:hypothetical protein
LSCISAACLSAQDAQNTTSDPYPDPIVANQGVITVTARPFATLPDIGGAAPRMMLLLDQSDTRPTALTTPIGAWERPPESDRFEGPAPAHSPGPNGGDLSRP